MTLVDGTLAFVIADQPVQGAAATSIATLVQAPGTLDTTDGLVLGSITAGIDESGIDYQIGRRSRDFGETVDGLTPKFGSFLNVEALSLTFAWPISGPKNDITTPVDTDFQFTEGIGIASLYRACGLFGATWAGGTGWEYKPAAAQRTTIAIFDSGSTYVFIDCLGSLEMVWTPGEAGVQTATFTAKLDAATTIHGVPASGVDYGDQDDHPAPVISSALNTLGGTSRGWSEMSISLDNGIETTPDSNAEDGIRIEQASRLITLSTTLDTDSADESQDYDNLKQTDATLAEELTFKTVTGSSSGDPALSYQIEANNLEYEDLGIAQPARARSNVITAKLTAPVDGGDFSYINN